MAGMGVFVGNDPSSVTAFENWVGAPVEFLAAHTGQASWSDWTNSISWLADQFKNQTANLTWSIPMFADGGSLEQGATGAYDAHYTDAAKALLAASSGKDKIYVRVGEEFNGTWMNWSAAGKEQEFIDTYRNFVDAFRQVSDKFVFEWNVNIGDYGMNPADAYPGDDYVDIVGMDFYYDVNINNKDSLVSWNGMVSRTYGLQWLEDFAAAHGKPTAYSEWGVNSDDAGAYIQKAHEWFESHNVVYQQYWDSDEAFAGALNDGSYPNASQAYLDAFGSWGSSTLVVGDDLANDLAGAAAASVLRGMGGDDTLTAHTGADTLDGGTGADHMTGGAGNDLYYVDNVGDVVVEVANGGVDKVISSVSYTLAAWVENLELTGSAGLSGTGNASNNVIIGNSGANTLTGLDGNDTLDGGLGADILKGGAGNDIYLVERSTDQVIELASEGTDTVRSSVSWTLAANVEDLELGGIADSYGIGNELANRITGNAGANTLKGMAGDDVIIGGDGADTINGGTGYDLLTGGAGADTFVFDTLTNSTTARPDLITDFQTGDLLNLSMIDANTLMTGNQAFHVVSAFTGAVGELKVVYDAGTDRSMVTFDVNGDGASDGAILIVGAHTDTTGWLL
jgi:Ca2+-binding RTX toxin-like protein